MFFVCHTPDGPKLQQWVGVFKGKGRLEGISQRQDIGKNSKCLGLGYFEDLRRFRVIPGEAGFRTDCFKI